MCLLNLTHVSVEFDPFGFSVKDFQMGMVLMRCESQDKLYPITNTSTNKNKFPSEFAALSTSIWHDCLGHPGASILDSLWKNKMIDCIATSNSNSIFCHSCPLGKHIKMPIINSTLMPFDILHSDVWTSPVLSTSGHKYYVLFLDNHSKILWTFPISHKFQVFSTFQK